MNSSPLHAYLFGPLAIFWEEEPRPLPASTTARSLLAYLLFHRERPQPRPVLAGLFWPEMEEARARRALSQALWQVRRILPEAVQADRETIHIPPDAPVWVDVEEFGKLVRPLGGETGRLGDAAALYRGDLLEGFYDDWVLPERERLRETYLGILEQLIGLEKSAGRYQEALEFALTLSGADPLRETAHREAMRLYHLLDRPQTALQQFEACRQILASEMGLKPEPETIALAREIAHRSGRSAAPYLPETPQPAEPIPLGETHLLQLPLVGRGDERAELLTYVEAILDVGGRDGGLVLVEGEAGVGKTRLVEETARDAEWRGAQVLWGRSHELGATPPYGPLVEALGNGLSPLRAGQLIQAVEKIWLQVLNPLIPELASHLPNISPPPPLEPAQERDRLIEALARFLDRWARITPLILILEDLHWSDRDTLDLLPALARRMDKARLLLIGTYRSEEARAYPILWEKFQAMDRAGLRGRLTLARLDEGATGEMVRRCLGISQSAPVFESRLYEETEGNPLFVVETLRALYDEGILARDKAGDWSTPWDETTHDYAELPLPTAVEQVITRRLDRLLPALRETLNAAAVLGSRFDYSLLSASAELDTQALQDAVGALVRRHFLRETPREYRFSHEKIRQVVYQAIPPGKRRQLHRQVGEALENLNQDLVELLAHHFTLSRVWDKAADYHQQAGDRARLIYASAEAINCYDRAIESWSRLPSSNASIGLKLYQERGRICQETGRFDQAETDFRVAYKFAEQVEDKASLSRILNYQSYLQFQRGDFDGAATVARQALDLATVAGLSSEIAAGLLNEANALRNLGHYQQAIEPYEQAAAIFEKLDDQPRLADCLNRMGGAFIHTGAYTQAQFAMERSLTIRRRLDDRIGISYCLINLAGLCYAQGQFACVRQTAQEALELASAIGDPYGEDAALQVLGLAVLELESPTQAISFFQRALRIAREIGDRALETGVLADLGMAYRYMGDLDKAQEMLEQSLRMAAISVERDHLSHVHSHLAQLSLDMGQYDEAIAHARAGLQKAQELGEPWSLGRAHWIMGEVVAHLGDDKAGAEPAYHFDESARILRELGAEAELAHSLAAYGLYLRCSGQARRGATLIDEARTLFQRLGMERALARLEAEVDACLLPSQLKVRLPHVGAPTGRPLRDDEWVEITWTVETPSDDKIPKKVYPEHSRRATRRRCCLLRLLGEARAQDAAPTVGNLAAALRVSGRTIKRDLAALRQEGHAVETRGSRMADEG